MDRIEKPWGYEEIIYNGLGWRIKKLVVDDGEMTSEQFHNKKFEVWFYSDGIYKIIKPKEIHRLIGKIEVIEIAFGSDNDIIRISDKYGRINKCYCDIFPCILVKNKMVSDKNLYHCVAFERKGCIWKDR